MTIIDTIADAHYGDRIKMAMAFADLLNQEARALQADGIDIVQFDEPAFNAYTKEAAGWGIEALHRAIDGLTCTTAVHIRSEEQTSELQSLMSITYAVFCFKKKNTKQHKH